MTIQFRHCNETLHLLHNKHVTKCKLFFRQMFYVPYNDILDFFVCLQEKRFGKDEKVPTKSKVGCSGCMPLIHLIYFPSKNFFFFYFLSCLI